MPQRADESFEEYRLRQQTREAEAEAEAEMIFGPPEDYIPGEWIKVRLVWNDGPLVQFDEQ